MLVAMYKMLIECDKSLRMLIKALVIFPPMFRLVYLLCRSYMVCSIEQLDARFSMISPLM